MNNYGTREIARANANRDKKELSETFCNLYTMQIVLSIAVIIAYSIYIVFVFNGNVLLAVTQGIVLLGTATDISWFYFGIEEFKVTVTRNIVVKILTAIIIIIFVKQPDDVLLYSVAIGGSQLISNAILMNGLRKRIGFIKPSFEKVLPHFKPNLVLFVPVVAASFYVYIDKIMIGNMANDFDVGYYESMEKIVNVPNALIIAVTMVMFPRISSIVKIGKEHKLIRDYVEKSILLVLFFSVGCSFGLTGIAELLVPLFFGEEYQPVVFLLCIGGFILIPRGLRQVIKSELLLPKGMDKQVTIAISIGAIVDFVLNLMLISYYQALGATIATIICEIISCIIMAIYTKTKWVYIQFLHLLPFSVIGFLMLIVLQNMSTVVNKSWVGVFALVFVGIVIYTSLSVLYIYLFKKMSSRKKRIC